MPRLARITRKVPATGSFTDAFVGCLAITEKITGLTQDVETFHEHGNPANFIKVARQVATANEGTLYPHNGASAVLPTAPASNGGTTLKLPSDILQGQADATIPPAGLLVTFTSGAAVGVYNRITGISSPPFSTSNTVTVERAWATAEGVPAAGDGYRLLVDISWAKTCHLRGEYSANAQDQYAQWLPLLWDWGQTLAVPAVNRAAIGTPHTVQTLAPVATQQACLESGYWQANPQSFESKGLCGLSFVLWDVLGGVTTSLWAAVT